MELKGYKNSNAIIREQIPDVVRIKRMSSEESKSNYDPESDLYVANINVQHLRKFNLRCPIVQVQRIHPQIKNLFPYSGIQVRKFLTKLLSDLKNGRYRLDEPSLFLLQGTRKPIFAIYENPFTKESVLGPCIEAPNEWFEKEGLFDYPDIVDALIKSRLDMDYRTLSRYF